MSGGLPAQQASAHKGSHPSHAGLFGAGSAQAKPPHPNHGLSPPIHQHRGHRQPQQQHQQQQPDRAQSRSATSVAAASIPRHFTCAHLRGQRSGGLRPPSSGPLRRSRPAGARSAGRPPAPPRRSRAAPWARFCATDRSRRGRTMRGERALRRRPARLDAAASAEPRSVAGHPATPSQSATAQGRRRPQPRTRPVGAGCRLFPPPSIRPRKPWTLRWKDRARLPFKACNPRRRPDSG